MTLVVYLVLEGTCRDLGAEGAQDHAVVVGHEGHLLHQLPVRVDRRYSEAQWCVQFFVELALTQDTVLV